MRGSIVGGIMRTITIAFFNKEHHVQRQLYSPTMALGMSAAISLCKNALLVVDNEGDDAECERKNETRGR